MAFPTDPTDRLPIVVLDHEADVAALSDVTGQEAVPPSQEPPPRQQEESHHDHPVPTSTSAITGTPAAAATSQIDAGRRPAPRARRSPVCAPPARSQPASEPRPSSLLGDVTALARLDLAGLRNQWRRLYGTDPPGMGRDLLRRRLAYRIQELAIGGLAAATRERLRIIEEKERAKPAKHQVGIPAAGTVLVREFKGIRHEVVVLKNGFSYQGKPWRSLSAIAKAIAGAHRDGPLFFGLRSRRDKGGND